MPQGDGIVPGSGDQLSGAQAVDAFVLICSTPSANQWSRLLQGNVLGSVLVSGSPFADSVTPSGGSVTAPAANQAIAIITPSATGTYSITVTAGLLAGTPVSLTEAANMALRVGGTTLVTLAVPAAVGTPAPFGPFRTSVNGSNAISVNAVVAGTAGVIYGATLAVTRIA